MKNLTIALVFSIGALAAAESALTGGKENAEIPAEASYANDLGPDTVDVSSYPAIFQKVYKGAFQKCAKCHSLARPLNSQFLELSKKEIRRIGKETPELLEDSSVLKIDSAIWKRYVKRMMAKPGCDIKSKEGKAIWEFLVFDGKERKAGKNLEKWLRHRRKLLEEFREKYPERYKENYGVSEED